MSAPSKMKKQLDVKNVVSTDSGTIENDSRITLTKRNTVQHFSRTKTISKSIPQSSSLFYVSNEYVERLMETMN